MEKNIDVLGKSSAEYIGQGFDNYKFVAGIVPLFEYLGLMVENNLAVVVLLSLPWTPPKTLIFFLILATEI